MVCSGLFSLQGRFVGKQFDDDQNLFPMDRFYTMDLQVGRAIAPNLEILPLPKICSTSATRWRARPIVNLGPPVVHRAGLRLNLPAEQ